MPPKKTSLSPKPVAATSGVSSLSLTSLQELLELMKQYDLTEFEHVQIRGGIHEQLVLKRGSVVTPNVALPTTTIPSPDPPSNVAPKENTTYITSPLVGTFYRSPSPEAASFVDVGVHIHRGQKLCIVEAMKLMNEIESEVDGVITEILVENGKPVEYGHKLFKVALS